MAEHSNLSSKISKINSVFLIAYKIFVLTVLCIHQHTYKAAAAIATLPTSHSVAVALE